MCVADSYISDNLKEALQVAQNLITESCYPVYSCGTTITVCAGLILTKHKQFRVGTCSVCIATCIQSCVSVFLGSRKESLKHLVMFAIGEVC